MKENRQKPEWTAGRVQGKPLTSRWSALFLLKFGKEIHCGFFRWQHHNSLSSPLPFHKKAKTPQEMWALTFSTQDGKQPQLIVMGNLDRERWDSYDLTIKVQDGGSPPRASSALLRVTVLDTNDNAPKFERPSYEAELSENSPIGHSVIQVRDPFTSLWEWPISRNGSPP